MLWELGMLYFIPDSLGEERKCINIWKKLSIRGEKRNYSLNISGAGEEGFVRLISEVSRRTQTLLVLWHVDASFFSSTTANQLHLNGCGFFFFPFEEEKIVTDSFKVGKNQGEKLVW